MHMKTQSHMHGANPRGKYLPRQPALEEVQQNESQGFKVVSSGLFQSKMCIETGIACCAGQVLILLVRYVLIGLGIPKPLGKPKIYAIYLICSLASSHQEIVWFDVPEAHKSEAVTTHCV